MKKTQIALGFLAIAIVALAFGAYLFATVSSPPSSFSTTAASSFTTSSTFFAYSPSSSSPLVSSSISESTSNSQWQVVSKNLIVYYGPACMVYETFNFSCPTLDTVQKSPSLGNVQLIHSEGMYYYLGDFSFTWNGQPESYVVWFTNSTIFCVSPSYEQYAKCQQ